MPGAHAPEEALEDVQPTAQVTVPHVAQGGLANNTLCRIRPPGTRLPNVGAGFRRTKAKITGQMGSQRNRKGIF